MKQTPLFAAHQARGGLLEVNDDWMLVERYGPGADAVAAELDAMSTGVGIIDLAQVETVLLSGPDARRFCNGMFTNNIKALRPGQGNRSAMCDDRGFIHGLLDIYCTDEDAFFCVLEGVTAEWFENRYQMYIVFDDVELETFAESPWTLSLQGPESERVLTALGMPVPTVPGAHQLVSGDESTPGIRVCAKDRTGTGGFDLFVPSEVLDTTFQAAISAGAQPIGYAALDALRITAGRARWPHDAYAKALVHQLRLDVECCNFDKGCYLGQEVINRIDVKKQLGKRLTGLVLTEDSLPPDGAEVFLEGAAVGTVSSTARAEGRALALGVLRKRAWEPGTHVEIRAGDRSVPAIVSDLPFP